MTTSLADRACTACRAGTAKLSPGEIAHYLAQVPGWQLSHDPDRIERRWKFGNFAEAFAFVSRVADLAEAADHHPDIGLGWGYASVSLHTHAAGGLHENDFILAARIG
ncbi:4a-hydroxytetrahydrobiopterin dehydratase [Lichenicoccus roseus]|uniref:Putative pterin-4-alpha-carbinolamine dehydratase n=1 Tax=Lichenicoccus roseus TaxID=2683649 RepID=A0A5R9J6D7_9PROT|nr:4a-hydroxytetrahydrobiopterin dehydratase [Lichenicoccus roseus]TLU72423.1 4a-hydroxytetrahydrobiopterin dehydratase [Lichenicoccus roseus]